MPVTGKIQIQKTFDYSLLSETNRSFIQEKAFQIRQLGKQVVSDVLNIGKYLVEVKDRLPHGTWLPWLESEFGWAERTAQNFMNVFRQFKSATVADLPIDLKALYLLAAASTPEESRLEAIKLAETGEHISHARAREIVENPVMFHSFQSETEPLLEAEPKSPDVNNKFQIHFSSKTDKWNTPREILTLVESVLGEIDLDPCSDSKECHNVSAKKHYVEEDDGLNQPWFGKVFMNPPYGDILDQWIDKLCRSYETGDVSEAIALINARTDTQWFRRFKMYPRCFVWGRLRFGDYKEAAPFPSMLVYLGKNLTRFKSVFAEIGDIYISLP